MRIIGGKLKRKKLGPVPGRGIRPTADRVRESIFNILAPSIRQAVVLDLFAGTGAMGIEALSRGAAEAVFLDHGPKALAAIRKNISACGLDRHARTIHWDAAKGLGCLATLPHRFTLVFMDPPYRHGLVEPTLADLHAVGALAAGARIVVEHSREEPIQISIGETELTAVFPVVDSRRYGKTLVSFFGYVI
jgi:16S rRNA (guanine966-N2)-methyltransferase